MKINGLRIPLVLLVPSILGILWLGGLSYQVSANADDLDNQADTAERLVKVETTVEYIQKDVTEIKEEQKSQDVKLDKILERVIALKD